MNEISGNKPPEKQSVNPSVTDPLAGLSEAQRKAVGPQRLRQALGLKTDFKQLASDILSQNPKFTQQPENVQQDVTNLVTSQLRPATPEDLPNVFASMLGFFNKSGKDYASAFQGKLSNQFEQTLGMGT